VRYRLFIDEVGHDNLKSSNTPQERHLCLMGVILTGRAHLDLKLRMDALKNEACGTSSVVLHRREIIDKASPFNRLADPLVQAQFDAAIMALITDTPYTALTIQIDKQAHIDKYKVWNFQPYHYCLAVMMERYVMFLKDNAGQGDVMAEWRGINQNMKLERSYSRLYRNGTDHVTAAEMQAYLSSSQIKIEKKAANVAGLQLADILASPASRYLICRKMGERMTATFGREVVRILLKHKLRRSPDGKVNGWGLKILP
jgi:hypothetical protein